MAAFNKEGTGSPDPNYLGYSKEPTRPRPVDYSGIFAGIGNAVTGVATGIDETNKKTIEDTLYAGIDTQRDAQGVALVTDAAAKDQGLFPGKEGASVPGAVNTHIEGIDKLQSAFAEGKIDSAYYYGKLNLLAKQVRSQYPNYRDYIDSKISTIAGVNPANALRSTIESNLKLAQSSQKSEQDRRQNFANQHMGELIAAGRKDMVDNPHNFTEAEMGAVAGPIKAQGVQYELENHNLELEIARGKVDSSRAETVVANRLGNITNQAVSGALTSLGPDVFKIIKGEVKPTPEQLQLINGELEKLKITLTQKQEEELTKIIGNSGQSLSGLIKDPAKVKQYKDEALAPIAALQDALSKGLAGNAKMIADMAKTKSEGAYNSALDDPGFKMLDTMGKVPQLLNVLQIQRPDVFTSATNTLITNSLLKTIAGHNQSFEDKVRVMADPNKPFKSDGTPNVQPSQVKQLLKDHAFTITSKDVDDNTKSTFVKTLFGEGNRGWMGRLLDANSRVTAYGMFVNPQVTKEILRLDGGKPGELFQGYSEWAKSNFHDLMKGQADALADADVNNPNAHISFDPASMTFKIETGSSAAGADPNSSANVQQDVGRVSKSLQDAANKLNTGLNNLKPILEAEGIKDPQAVVEQLTGFKVTDKKQAGFFSRVWDKVKNIELFTPDREAEPKKKSEINLDAPDSKVASAGSLTELINTVASEEGIDARLLHGIRAGESLKGDKYDVKDDDLESSWGPFQLNLKGGLGAVFEAMNPGKSVKDPSTIPDQVRFVARYIKATGDLKPWRGFKGARNPEADWGNSGYKPSRA